MILIIRGLFRLLPGLAFLLMVVAVLAAMQSKWFESTVNKAIRRA
jgi:hypothetical protein